MTFGAIKEKLDAKTTFGDFVTLALAFMACGALWWRVSAVEIIVAKQGTEIAPIIQDYKAAKEKATNQETSIGELKEGIKIMNGKIDDLAVAFARLQGALDVNKPVHIEVQAPKKRGR